VHSAGPDSHLAAYLNKSVRFRFFGADLQFQLSHALFSSFDIDDGSRLLLKSVAQKVDLPVLRSVLDIGCGVGTLGLCIASRATGAEVLLQDRDALAADVARSNAALNGLRNVRVSTGLAFQGLAEKRFDLVVCNVPAKAGTPVIQELFRQSSARLSSSGLAAFVVVGPLDELARSAAAAAGMEIAWEEKNPRYTVLHLTAPHGSELAASRPFDLDPYVRQRGRFEFSGTSWVSDTAYALPDFDTLGYCVENALALLLVTGARGRILVLNPGQGHLPVFLARRFRPSISGISLAGRDTLSLAISSRNLEAAGLHPSGVRASSCEATLAEHGAAGSVDLLCAMPVPVPHVSWQPDLVASAHVLLPPGGRLLVSASSTEVQRLAAAHPGFSLVESRKHFGFRSVLLERR
jgi:SAM-dependent methyltransferase